MSIFEPATTIDESPVTGQEEAMTAEQDNEAQEYTETEGTEVETGAEETTQYQEEGSPSDEETEQGEETEQFDFATAYKELRKDYTRKAQELAELKRQGQPPMQQQGQGQGPDIEQLTNQFWDEFQRDPVNTLYRFADSVADQRLQGYRQQVEQMIVPIYEGQAANAYAKNMNEVAKVYPDLHTNDGFHKFNEKLSEIAQELGNPNMVHNPPKRVLDMAAREVFGESTARLYQKAKAQGKEEALNNIRTKQGLAPATGAKQKEQPISIEDQIANSIVGAGRKGGIFG